MRPVLKYIARRMGETKNYRFRARFADGSELKNYADDNAPDVGVHFKDWWTEWYSLLFFYEGLVEKHVEGHIDLEGEHPISKLMAIGHEVGLLPEDSSIVGRVYDFRNPLMGIRSMWQQYRDNNLNRAQSIKNADYHYALPPELFEHMLGGTVGYCEGYWIEGTKTLDQAKHNIYEYICRKLRIESFDHVVDVGAGWGFLPIYIVKNYGARVTVYNPVKRQNEYMRARFERNGVADKIRIVEGVHDDIMSEPNEYDKFVTTGVHEHHGLDRRMYALWWKSIETALKPGGIGLISTSSTNHRSASNFLSLKYTWPGGHLPSIPEEITELHKHGMMLIELENLWPHYRRTLEAWRARFKEHWPDIQRTNPEVFNERFYRHWSTVYLEGIAQTFTHYLDNSHILFQKGRDADHYPWTREFKYQGNFKTGDDAVECHK